ncbi:MAG: signal peptide peptidase SppA [Spartobacteria bacterium]|nr:signal peptide peptidase SppA [Spartobacteria bacterium]
MENEEQSMVEVKNKSRGCLLGCLTSIVVLLGLGLIVSLAVNGIMAMAMSQDSSFADARYGAGVDEKPRMEERWSYGEGETKVARIQVKGFITDQGKDNLFANSMSMAERVMREIRSATQDLQVKAILLEVDSPGGEITPADDIYYELQRFKISDPQRRVIAFFRGLSASGGYYVAMASDWIVCEPTCIVGSIGVIMQGLNWSTLSDKVGVTDVTLTSGPSKDLLNPFQPVRETDKEILQTVVNGLYRRFLSIVCEGRGLPESVLRPYADGRVFLPADALEIGLVDQIGYFDSAMEACRIILEEKQLRFIRYANRTGFLESLTEVKSPIPDLQTLAEQSRARALFYWNR